MPYDDMTDAEYQEYYNLYRNPPNSIRGRAERFVQLAEKGWVSTRAADDCFENGNGDAVLLLVLRKVKASPPLKELLRNWGYWSKDWEQKLENLDEGSFGLIITEFEWQSFTIQLLYRPQWTKAVETMSHLEIQVIEPEKPPLPITETGYRSHFFPSNERLTEAELITQVQGWLEEEAKAPKWQALEQQRQQLTLF